MGRRKLTITSNSQLKGPIPTTIGECTELRVCMLWGTQLSGQVPEEITRCKNLKTLQIQNTAMKVFKKVKEMEDYYEEAEGVEPWNSARMKLPLKLSGNTGCGGLIVKVMPEAPAPAEPDDRGVKTIRRRMVELSTGVRALET